MTLTAASWLSQASDVLGKRMQGWLNGQQRPIDSLKNDGAGDRCSNFCRAAKEAGDVCSEEELCRRVLLPVASMSPPPPLPFEKSLQLSDFSFKFSRTTS